MNSYKLSTIGIADSNKSMKSKEDEATQTSHSVRFILKFFLFFEFVIADCLRQLSRTFQCDD